MYWAIIKGMVVRQGHKVGGHLFAWLGGLGEAVVVRESLLLSSVINTF